MANAKAKPVKKAKPKAVKPKAATKTPRATKPKAVAKVTDAETIEALKKQIEVLQNQLNETLTAYGKMHATMLNFNSRADAMLGMILKGLFEIGIGPDELARKCSQIFRKKIQAD